MRPEHVPVTNLGPNFPSGGRGIGPQETKTVCNTVGCSTKSTDSTPTIVWPESGTHLLACFRPWVTGEERLARLQVLLMREYRVPFRNYAPVGRPSNEALDGEQVR